MTQTLENAVNFPEEQHFFKRGLSWEQFKAIQASFENVAGVRLFYCEGILEIVSIGNPHKAIKCLTGLPWGSISWNRALNFFPVGVLTRLFLR